MSYLHIPKELINFVNKSSNSLSNTNQNLKINYGQNIIFNDENKDQYILFLSLLNGTKIIKFLNYNIDKIVNDISTREKRIDQEKNILENIKKIIVEENNPYNSFENICSKVQNFLNLDKIELNYPLEQFSKGTIAKINYSIFLFLHCDLMIIDKIPESIDFHFKNKIISQIKEIISCGKKIVFFKMNSIYLEKYFDENYLEQNFYIYDFNKLIKYVIESDEKTLTNDFKVSKDINSEFDCRKYIDNVSCYISDGQSENKYIKKLENDIFFNLEFDSKLDQDFNFKIILKIVCNQTCIYSFNEPNWRNSDMDKKVRYKIKLPKFFPKNIVAFHLTIKSENKNERNCGKVFYPIKNVEVCCVKFETKNPEEKRNINQNFFLDA